MRCWLNIRCILLPAKVSHPDLNRTMNDMKTIEPTTSDETTGGSSSGLRSTDLVDDAVIQEYQQAENDEKLKWKRFDDLCYANHDKIAQLRCEVDDAREEWGIAYSRMKQLARQIEKSSTAKGESPGAVQKGNEA